VVAVQMRGAEDCGCAALASVLACRRLAYEDVAAQCPDRGQRGLRTRELVSAARRLGQTLTATRAYDLDRDEGVLRVRSTQHHRDGHWVAVRYGLVWDPADGWMRPWRTYRDHYGARFGTLLRGAFTD
jgi:ABC-type bacteriocin/lantibiotic exporter with double-glycine peptidase domain